MLWKFQNGQKHAKQIRDLMKLCPTAKVVKYGRGRRLKSSKIKNNTKMCQNKVLFQWNLLHNKKTLEVPDQIHFIGANLFEKIYEASFSNKKDLLVFFTLKATNIVLEV